MTKPKSAKPAASAQPELVNKSQRIRDMLQEMGADASPTQVARRLAERGIKVTANMVSMIKTKERQKSGAASWQVGGARRTVSAGGLALQDVAIIRQLAKKLGKANVKRLVDVVGD